ncbi:hypothetical protein [Streptomyces microflavus]|uniref:hypothetical protein n=1 Tax=Streptomyces microflavus TaxID=1919 RepID=UPI0036686BBE
MEYAVPFPIICGLVLLLLIRFKQYGVSAVALAILTGFYLSTSSAAPSINQIISAVGSAVRSLVA